MLCALNSLGTPVTKNLGGSTKLTGRVRFNGAGYLYTNQSLAFGTAQFTVEFWYKPQSSATTTQCIIGFGDNTTGSSVWVNYNSNANRITFFNETTASTQHTASTLLTDNVWHHVAIQRNSANRIQIYINGTLAYTSGTTITTSFTFTAGYRFGRYLAASGNYTVVNNTEFTAFRASNIARYSANFTPSQDQIPAGSNTFVIFNFKDASTYLQTEGNGYSLTNNGSVSWVSGFP